MPAPDFSIRDLTGDVVEVRPTVAEDRLILEVHESCQPPAMALLTPKKARKIAAALHRAADALEASS